MGGIKAMKVNRMKKSKHPLKDVLATAVMTGAISLLGYSPVRAAVLSFGTFPGDVFGGENCADVRAGSINNATPVDSYNCTAAPNQQFEFNGKTIYALGGQMCLDVASPDSNPTAGTLVDTYFCNGGPNQQWTYQNGAIINASGFCLDATSGGQNHQLEVNDCSGVASQQWQIK